MIKDKDKRQPVQLGFFILETLSTLYGESLKERPYPTVAYTKGSNHLERLTAVYQSFGMLQSGFNLKLIWAAVGRKQWRTL